MRLFVIFIVFVLGLDIPVWAQDEFKNTLSLAENNKSPEASLEVISWLSGHWRGKAFGGEVEEVWASPLGGSMMGSFKLVADGEVQFYELETISEEHGTLILRLKHFTSVLKGWEEKEETVDFKLVKVEPGKVFFDGFTIERIAKNEINMYVRIDHGDNVEEVLFNYHRVE